MLRQVFGGLETMKIHSHQFRLVCSFFPALFLSNSEFILKASMCCGNIDLTTISPLLFYFMRRLNSISYVDCHPGYRFHSFLNGLKLNMASTKGQQVLYTDLLIK